MTPPNTYELRMDPNNMATLVQILEEAEARRKALAKLNLVSAAEKTVLIGEAAVCQYAYLQLLGIYYQNPTGAPDWSAAEASGKLPSEALVDAGIVTDHFGNPITQRHEVTIRGPLPISKRRRTPDLDQHVSCVCGWKLHTTDEAEAKLAAANHVGAEAAQTDAQPTPAPAADALPWPPEADPYGWRDDA